MPYVYIGIVDNHLRGGRCKTFERSSMHPSIHPESYAHNTTVQKYIFFGTTLFEEDNQSMFPWFQVEMYHGVNDRLSSTRTLSSYRHMALKFSGAASNQSTVSSLYGSRATLIHFFIIIMRIIINIPMSHRNTSSSPIVIMILHICYLLQKLHVPRTKELLILTVSNKQGIYLVARYYTQL